MLDRGRENRSQIVFTTARGRDVVFWQSPRTRKQARPNVRIPTARAAGITELEIVVDSHEQYPYRFAGQQVRTVKRALPCGDYGITVDGRLVATVERKSLPDLVTSITTGKLRHALGELAALPRAAVVIEDRNQRHAATVLAEYQDHYKLSPSTSRTRPSRSPTPPPHSARRARSARSDATTDSETSSTNIGRSHDMSRVSGTHRRGRPVDGLIGGSRSIHWMPTTLDQHLRWHGVRLAGELGLDGRTCFSIAPLVDGAK